MLHLGVPHYATGKIQVGDLIIPPGTMIFPNLHRITRNPKVFAEAKIFKPDRFLDSDGNYRKIDDNVAFSVGKRDCLGKSLALTEFFLFFACLLQRYSFQSTEKDVDINPHVAFTQSPKPFQVKLKILSK